MLSWEYYDTMECDKGQYVYVCVCACVLQVAGKSWYGGGCDLTPFYLNVQDTTDFHHYWKNTCDTYQTGLYDKYKQWCDK